MSDCADSDSKQNSATSEFSGQDTSGQESTFSSEGLRKGGVKRQIDETLLSGDELQKLEARRAYNRKCAANARKRSKELISSLQMQVEQLSQDKAELQRRNDVMRAQLDLLEAQNRTLIINQRQPQAQPQAQAHAPPVYSSSGLNEMIIQQPQQQQPQQPPQQQQHQSQMQQQQPQMQTQQQPQMQTQQPQMQTQQQPQMQTQQQQSNTNLQNPFNQNQLNQQQFNFAQAAPNLLSAMSAAGGMGNLSQLQVLEALTAATRNGTFLNTQQEQQGTGVMSGQGMDPKMFYGSS